MAVTTSPPSTQWLAGSGRKTEKNCLERVVVRVWFLVEKWPIQKLSTRFRREILAFHHISHKYFKKTNTDVECRTAPHNIAHTNKHESSFPAPPQ